MQAQSQFWFHQSLCFRFWMRHSLRDSLKKSPRSLLGINIVQTCLAAKQSCNTCNTSSTQPLQRLHSTSLLICLLCNSALHFNLPWTASQRKTLIHWGPLHFQIALLTENFLCSLSKENSSLWNLTSQFFRCYHSNYSIFNYYYYSYIF